MLIVMEADMLLKFLMEMGLSMDLGYGQTNGRILKYNIPEIQ